MDSFSSASVSNKNPEFVDIPNKKGFFDAVKIQYPRLSDGQKIFYLNFPQSEAKTQFKEIFEDQYYKKGITGKNIVVVDIGASMGMSVTYFQPHAKMIYACEPCEPVYKSLNENTKDYDNIKTFNFGISGLTRLEVLYGYGDLPPNTYQLKANVTSTEIIRLIAIDEFFLQNKIEHVDLLKVDCEGREYEIFGSESFSKVVDKIDYIIGEAHSQDGFLIDTVPVILKEYGFKTTWLPFLNMTSNVRMADQLGGKEFHFSYPSIFFAERNTK